MRNVAATLSHNPDAEASVFGLVLLDNATIEKAADILNVDDSYGDENQSVWRAMLDLSIADTPTDAMARSKRSAPTWSGWPPPVPRYSWVAIRPIKHPETRVGGRSIWTKAANNQPTKAPTPSKPWKG